VGVFSASSSGAPFSPAEFLADGVLAVQFTRLRAASREPLKKIAHPAGSKIEIQ